MSPSLWLVLPAQIQHCFSLFKSRLKQENTRYWWNIQKSSFFDLSVKLFSTGFPKKGLVESFISGCCRLWLRLFVCVCAQVCGLCGWRWDTVFVYFQVSRTLFCKRRGCVCAGLSYPHETSHGTSLGEKGGGVKGGGGGEGDSLLLSVWDVLQLCCTPW